MAEDLFLRLAGDYASWILLDDVSGVIRFRGEGSLDEFAELTRDLDWSGRTRVLIASEDVLLTSADVPSKQARQILQAVPYMVEDLLATDVDECHFAIGPRNDAGEVTVAVIDESVMTSMVERLYASGIRPASITTDVLHLPMGNGASILIDGGRALVRTASHAGFSVELSLLPLAVSTITNLDQVSIYVHPSEIQALELYLSQIQADFTGDVTVHELDTGPFEWLCRGYNPGAINLLQGEFEVEADKSHRGSGWRAVAVLAACAFGLHLMLLVGQGIYLDVQAQQYEGEARALYAEVFPSDSNVRDVRRRWEAHLRAGSGQADGEFFDLFTETARYLPEAELTLQNVNFSESRGDLNLQLVASRSEQFVAFAQTLSKVGLQAEVGTISQDDGRARGSVKIKTFGGNP